LLAAFARASLRALASRHVVAASSSWLPWNFHLLAVWTLCVRRRSVSNCLADVFVIPPACCASLQTHRSKVWHFCIFNFGFLLPESCGTSLSLQNE
jgi:hypothetical protein